MDSRERVSRALSFEKPDRVPRDFWTSSGFKRKLLETLQTSEEEFLDAHDVDLRYIEGPRYIGPSLERPDGSSTDIWGVSRTAVEVQTAEGVETYQEIRSSPLASASTVEEIMDYPHWPSPDWFDYSEIEAQCRRVREKGRVAVFQGDRMNRIAQLKPAMYIRGIEQIMMDLSLNPEMAHAVFGCIRRFYTAYAERIFDAAKGQLDILLMGDDFGSQNGPLLSPGMWVEFLGDGFAEYAAIARSAGAKVMHHTCGSVRPIIPLMVERGLDVLQSIQPEASDMDPAVLKRDFGNELCFHGGISIQQTLPFGKPEDVRKEVKQRIEALAPGGGYILCTSHNIQADTPVENALELLRAYSEYGSY